jgi:hypothetical protein
MVSSKTRTLRTPTAVGFACILIFNICMAAAGGTAPHNAYWGFAVILGAGIGIILPAIMVVAQLSTPPDLISTASALVIAARGVGGTVGLAINNAIFNSTVATEIPKRIAAAVIPLGLPPSSIGQLIGALTSQNTAALAKVPGASPQIIGAAAGALTSAYNVGFRNAWIAACCFCVVAIIGKSPLFYFQSIVLPGLLINKTASLFFYDPRSEFNAHIDAPAEYKLIEEQDRIEGRVTEHDHDHSGSVSEKNEKTEA